MQTLRKETRAPEPRKCKQDFFDFGNRGHFTILVHLFHFTDKETVAERIHHHTSSACSQHKHILHSKLLTELNKNPIILTLYSGLWSSLLVSLYILFWRLRKSQPKLQVFAYEEYIIGK